MHGRYFAGNFWWATADYLADLSEPGEADRYDAELWIGLGSPRLVDTSPENAVTYWNEAFQRLIFLCVKN